MGGSRAPLCKRGDELVDHLFIECGFTKVVWNLVAEDLNLNFDWGEGGLHENFKIWYKTIFPSEFSTFLLSRIFGRFGTRLYLRMLIQMLVFVLQRASHSIKTL